MKSWLQPFRYHSSVFGCHVQFELQLGGVGDVGPYPTCNTPMTKYHNKGSNPNLSSLRCLSSITLATPLLSFLALTSFHFLSSRKSFASHSISCKTKSQCVCFSHFKDIDNTTECWHTLFLGGSAIGFIFLGAGLGRSRSRSPIEGEPLSELTNEVVE